MMFLWVTVIYPLMALLGVNLKNIQELLTTQYKNTINPNFKMTAT